MDPFTKGVLERAEQRSRTLGISKSTKFPLAEYEQKANKQQQQMELQQQQQQLAVAKQKADREVAAAACTTPGSPSKLVRNFSVGKENMGIEINITTDKNVEVQVEVEERDIDADGNCISSRLEEPQAKIRDCSRNRLQRLGALYSDNVDLSSPIHRTEAQFHEDDDTREFNTKRTKSKFGKLAALADSIKTWEDDTSHPDFKANQQFVDKKSTQKSTGSPEKRFTPNATTSAASSPQKPPQVVAIEKRSITGRQTDLQEKKKQWEKSVIAEKEREQQAKSSKEKKLQWDKTVMDSLEAQGFQRRQSDQSKICFNYSSDETNRSESDKIVSKSQTDNSSESRSSPKPTTDEPKKVTNVRSGLVSGRAAVFESKSAASPQKPSQKDPAEMSLKERMALFEKNKGQALVPKAAFAMAVPISKVRTGGGDKRNGDRKEAGIREQAGQMATTSSKADGLVRDKVAALTSASSTISESKIKADLMKQRQQDMEVLSNRFNRQRDFSETSSEMKSSSSSASLAGPPASSTSTKRMAPPPPPPMPKSPATDRNGIKSTGSNKRRSPGNRDGREDNVQPVSVEKRIKVNPATSATNRSGRLYPVLSDIEVTSESDNDNCTSATVSLRSGVGGDGSSGSANRKQSGRHDARINAIEKVNRGVRDDDADDYDIEEEEDDDEDDDSKKELNESFMESEDSDTGICNVSLGREIMQVVRSNEKAYNNSPRKSVRYCDTNIDAYGGGGGGGDSSLNSGMTSDGSADVDDYLDEALDDESDTESDSYAKPNVKGTTNSNSFSYKKLPKSEMQYQTITEEGADEEYRCNGSQMRFKSPVKSALTINPADDNNMVTLVHTVSFYRRQQSSNSNNSTPVRRIQREQKSPSTDFRSDQHNSYAGGEDSESDHEDAYLVQEKIKRLLDEVCKQQQIIAQTSQALNLCAATIEFSGSTESVEGERHLLVATHRRQAALDEVQRLRVEGSLRPHGAPKEKGRLTVREITVPLRQDYVRKLSADTISGHHLVCLLKYNENVLATKTIPTLPGLMAAKFPDTLQLNNVYADFKITLEVYGMTAQREVLPHEVKYHINMNKKSGGRTPKKKGSDSRLIMPMVQSPAGPNVVRTPALVQYGFAIFSLREIQRNTWSLTPVSGVSPLEGIVHMKINCELSVSIEYSGFLTMYEDISGFGAWHRRWCHLNGHVLNYWKYPDDEKKKTPMGSIDLYSCCSSKVTTAPRDVCARLNTLLLECQRPAEPNDVESLVIVPRGKITIVRHLLSADTKEERDEWSAYFNKALTLLRAWGSKN